MSDTPSALPGPDAPRPDAPRSDAPRPDAPGRDASSGVDRSPSVPPPAGASLPTWDDDAIAAALEEQVRTYTSPITLPVIAPAPPAPPVASEPPSPSATGAPVVGPSDSLTETETETETPARPETAARPAPAPAAAWSAEPDHVAVDPFSEPPVDDEQLLQEIEGVGTLDAMQRLEEELHRRSAATGPVPATPEAPSFFDGAPSVSPPAPGPDPVAPPALVEAAPAPGTASPSTAREPEPPVDVFAEPTGSASAEAEHAGRPPTAPRSAEPPPVTGAIPFAALQPEPVEERTADPWAAAPAPARVAPAMPLSTDLPDIARRAELPPPPGYAEDGSRATSAPADAPGPAEQPHDELRRLPEPEGGWEQLLANAPLASPATPAAEEDRGDSEDDDVIDPEDRVPTSDLAARAPSWAPPADAATRPVLVEPLLPVPFAEPVVAEPVVAEPARPEPGDASVAERIAPPLVTPPVRGPIAPAAVAGAVAVPGPVGPPLAVVERGGIEPTPREQRAGRAARLFWLWFAATASVLSLGLGAVMLGMGMSLRQAVVAAVIGVALSFVPLGFTTLAGTWSSQPTVIVSRAAFGTTGNLLPTILAILVRVFWGGTLLWLLGDAVGRELVSAHADAGLGAERWAIVVVAAGAILTALVAVVGYGLLARVQLVLSIAGGLLIVGAAAVTLPQVHLDTALTRQDGPWVLVAGGAVLVFSFVGLAWAFSGSDLARYQRPGTSGTSSMSWATLGAIIPPLVLVVWGALLAASDPALAAGLAAHPLTAIAGVLPSWTTIPLLVAAAVGLLSGSGLSLYSGGFALQSLTPQLPRVAGVVVAAMLSLVAGVILVLMGADTGTVVEDAAVALAVPVAAWTGIFAAEMMIRRRRFHTPSLLAAGGVYPTVRWVNLVALVVISAIGYAFVVGARAGFGWEGYGWRLAGVPLADPLAAADLGVLLALLLGVLLPLATGIPAIRRQESAGAEPADVPAWTGPALSGPNPERPEP